MDKIIAFIPVRGGSKSIPLKNIKIINNKPLVYWVLKASEDCKYIDKTYVSTNSEEICKIVNMFKFSKVRIINRSEETATDTASTESAMLEFANNYQFNDIILIQATSPLLTKDDLENGISKYLEPNTDSVLSVVRQKRFLWEEVNGIAIPKNYDIFNRPRRQDFNGYLVENGAFYITSKKLLLQNKNRISGRIKFVEMSEKSYFEIDEPSDWLIIENLMKNINN